MDLLNPTLLKSPQNWLRVWFMLAIGFAAVFLVAHFLTPQSVERNPE